MRKYQLLQNKLIEILPHDKCLHFIVGFFLYLGLSYIFEEELSILLVLLTSLTKEVRDEIVYNGFDYKDIVFTIIPGIILHLTN